jgi:hypothetical protein
MEKFVCCFAGLKDPRDNNSRHSLAELVWGFWCQAFFVVVSSVFDPFQVSLFGWKSRFSAPACIQEVSRAEQRSTLP